MRFHVETNINTIGAENQIDNALAVIIRMMMEDIHRIAEPVTPKKSGNLRTGVTKVMEGPRTGIMRWHEPYAAVQEKGYRIDPRTGKMIVFTHYTTPGTHAGFVEEALNKVSERLPMYVQAGGLQ